MNLRMKKLLMTILLTTCCTTPLLAQASNAIEFRDSTGNNTTAIFGWQGDAANGTFFIQTPGGNNVEVKRGDMTVGGTVRADAFVGDGSALTGITGGSVSAQDVAEELKGDNAFLTSVKGEQGPVGPQGDKGEPGDPTAMIDGAIATAKIADSAITSAKMAKNSVASVALIDGAVTDAKISGTIVGTKIGSGINASNITSGTLSGARVDPVFDSRVIRTDGGNIRLRNAAGSNGVSLGVQDNIFYVNHTDGSQVLHINLIDKHAAFGGTLECTSLSERNTGSDRRLKQNIRPLESSLQLLMKLQGVSYEWRSDEFPSRGFNRNPEIGMIAQDVQQHVPEIVSQDSEGFLKIDYAKMTPLLLEALKEQQTQIEKMSKRLVELENRILSATGE